MADAQLWLFDPPQPLRTRLGNAFFRSIPTRPGVYVMLGHVPGVEGASVLYVGKSVNLRRRLASYHAVRPGRCSRRLVRLVHSVERIDWEECADERLALVRENQLIRELRPRFNRANTWPLGYWYVGLKAGVNGWFRLCLQHERAPDWEWFGAFRGSHGYGVLCRWLWRLQHGMDTDLPAAWVRQRPPRCLDFRLEGRGPEGADDAPGVVRDWLLGRSRLLMERVEAVCARGAGGGGFRQRLAEADLEALEVFWRTGLLRHREVRERAGITGSWIEREQLDDLLVLHGGMGCRREGARVLAHEVDLPAPARAATGVAGRGGLGVDPIAERVEMQPGGDTACGAAT